MCGIGFLIAAEASQCADVPAKQYADQAYRAVIALRGPLEDRIGLLGDLAKVYDALGHRQFAQQIHRTRACYVRLLPDKDIKNLGLWEIAESQATIGALCDAVCSASAISDEGFRGTSYAIIAPEFAKVGNRCMAHWALSRIRDPWWRDVAHGHIARVEFQRGDLRAAFHAIRSIQRHSLRDTALLLSVLDLAERRQVALADVVAGHISSTTTRARALLEIGTRIHDDGDGTAAREFYRRSIATMEKAVEPQTWMVSAALVGLGEHGAARNAAAAIGDEESRDEDLDRLAQLQASRDEVEEALLTAALISDPGQEATMIAIARALSDPRHIATVMEVLDNVKSQADSSYEPYALSLHAARLQAATGNAAKAHELLDDAISAAKSFLDYTIEPLTECASAASELGLRDKALALFADAKQAFQDDEDVNREMLLQGIAEHEARAGFADEAAAWAMRHGTSLEQASVLVGVATGLSKPPSN